MKKIVIAILLSAGLNTNILAQDNQNDKIVTAVPFLRVSPDARSTAMGDVGIALSPTAAGNYYNLAKSVFSEHNSAAGLNYTPWLKGLADDVYLATLSGYHKLDKNQAFSASLRYFNWGDFPAVDYNGSLLFTSKPREVAFDIGYARKLSSTFSTAIALRYIYSNLAQTDPNGGAFENGSAASADISVFYSGTNGWTGGVTLSNLGSKIRYTDAGDKDFLPANLGIGAAYKEVLKDSNSVTFAFEINKLLVPSLPADAEGMETYRNEGVIESWGKSFENQAWQFGFGIEYLIKKQIFLRGGYSQKTYGLGNWQYLTLGTGIKFSYATVNFSYQVPTGNKLNGNAQANTVSFGMMMNW